MSTFYHLDCKCDLYLGGRNSIISLLTSSHYGDHLCKVISKLYIDFKVKERHKTLTFSYEMKAF
jgi:hypothetical protein